MRRTLLTVILAALTLPSAALAAPTVTTAPVVDGLREPVQVTGPAGSTTLYIVEKRGTVRALVNGNLSTVIDISGRVRNSGEQGFLSIAFHPRFAQNGRVFLYYNDRATGDIMIDRLRLSGNRVVGGSRRTILRIPHRQADNHNGGQLAFGPDGYLYIGTGDGGGGGDQFGHAQNRFSLLGKMLRINVDRGRLFAIPKGNPFRTRGGLKSIWAIGLRNPWRFSFDRTTGNLWIGDVGQGQWEEIDRVRAGTRPLLNFGWSRFEGAHVFNASKRLRGGKLVRPVHEYDHGTGSSVIGGAVYRGSQAALAGYYVYGDLNGWIAGFRAKGDRDPFRIEPKDTLYGLSMAGDGEIYASYGDGSILRIVAS